MQIIGEAMSKKPRLYEENPDTEKFDRLEKLITGLYIFIPLVFWLIG